MSGLYGAEEKGGGNEVIFYGGCSLLRKVGASDA